MCNKVISVVIPVYNAEQFISVCLDSLLNQTYSDLEIILVDDGSRDGSLAACESYAQKDSRVRVIHQENQGVSAARNTGIQHASGSYIAFIDADDYVKIDYFERLYKDAQHSQADVVCCDFIEVLNGEEVHLNLAKVLNPRLIQDSYTLFADDVGNKEAYGTCVWGKLIKAEYAKQVKFKPLKFGEDQLYMFDIFLKKPVVYLDDYKGYYYIRNESSATLKSGERNIARSIDELEMFHYKLTHLPENAADLQSYYFNRYAMGLHALARAVVLCADETERESYRQMLCEKIKDAFKHPQMMSLRAKVYLCMYRYLPWVYRRLLLTKTSE